MFETILNPVLNPVFGGMMNWSPALVIAIVSLVLSLLITVIYKYTTDQVVMKDLKTRQKDLQKRLKEVRGDMEKSSKLQKEMMDLNMKYMSQSFKSMIFTFIPVIIIFGWLQGNIAFEPILPGHEFNVVLDFKEGYTGEVKVTVPEGIEIISGDTSEIKPVEVDAFLGSKQKNQANFTFKGDEGDYFLVFEYQNQHYDKELTVTNDQRYAKISKTFKNSPLTAVTIKNKKLTPINIFGSDEGGWFQGRFGWLSTYIIFSIIFSLVFRKSFKVY